MTLSLTLAGRPRAGANSKPHHYQQNVQRMKDLSKTWIYYGENSLNISDEKKTETKFSNFQKHPVEHMAPKCNF